MTCSNCGGTLTSGTGIDYIGTHARHSNRSDCIDVKNQRIAELEVALAAERKRVAELERDRERLQCLVRGIVSNACRIGNIFLDKWFDCLYRVSKGGASPSRRVP